MLIGICSDSHNDGAAMRRALQIFDGAGVERIIHCGDVGGPPVFDELVGREVAFVWGNMDAGGNGLNAYLQSVEISQPRQVPLHLEWADRRIAVFHGHEPAFRNAADVLSVDYIFHGHTHARRDERIGGVRVVNPGALHRARPRTVATLNLTTDALIFHEI